MLAYLSRRLLVIAPTLLFVSMLIFGLQQLLPGDPALMLAGENAGPEAVEFYRKKYHFDEPLPVRYAYWLGGVLKGDLGESTRISRPVRDLVIEKLPVTAQLAGMAFLVALIIGIPMGVLSAVKNNSA